MYNNPIGIFNNSVKHHNKLHNQDYETLHSIMKFSTLALLTLVSQAIAASVPVQNAARDLAVGSYLPRTTPMFIHV